ncbi:NAD(P)H-quinone oxidoreductase subunit 3, chloroplastic [Anaplasma platys]|uniref:NADH-quinone oxidoreductase subunit n=1 Tax=Anaplasma platys TaxID=949 RepID=A0A858PY08_9RICK|nr:NAD(P)H-quinone oxidoreductase subunit 3, chloroplastic [Anaplasma platys]
MFDVGEYSYVLVFCTLAALLSSLFAVLPIFLARRRDSVEKLVPYECGFDKKEGASSVFDIKFCVVGILFVIFDIEVTFRLTNRCTMFGYFLTTFCTYDWL